MSLLNVNDLSVSFVTRNGTTEVVKNVSFSVEAKSITAIIGESGSGKSVSCYAPVSYTHLTLPTNSRV